MPVTRFTAAHPAMLEAEEVNAFPALAQVHDPCLGLFRREAEVGQDRPQHTQCALGLPFGPAHHHEIVGVADEHTLTVRRPCPVKPVEVDVGQQRRDNAALWGPAMLLRIAPSCMTPTRNTARKSFRTWRSQTRVSIACINRSCGIASKHEAMSVSTTHRRP